MMMMITVLVPYKMHRLNTFVVLLGWFKHISCSLPFCLV